MLQCTDLTKSYKKKCVVNKLSFRVERGETFALLGSNGAGKTTTIKMILGLEGMDGGHIALDKDILTGYSPETPYFPPFLTGREVLAYYAAIQKLPRQEIKSQISELLNTVGLEDSGTKVRNFSKGMLQRLALAQALLGDPDLLILDEPTAGLDALGRLEMIRLIGRLRDAGRTIIINSHILSDIERICDRGIIMSKGVQMTTWNKADKNSKSLEEIFLDTVGGIDK